MTITISTPNTPAARTICRWYSAKKPPPEPFDLARVAIPSIVSGRVIDFAHAGQDMSSPIFPAATFNILSHQGHSSSIIREADLRGFWVFFCCF